MISRRLALHVKHFVSRWRNWFLLIVAFELLVGTTLLPAREPGEMRRVARVQPIKSILVWNSAHRIETSAFGTGADAFAKCPVSNCRITVNRTELKFHQYDAVVFHIHEMEVTKLPEELQFRRMAHQRYVMLTQESPLSMTTFKTAAFQNYFNWTMSYRLDSDVHLLYGRVTAKDSAPLDSHEIANRMAATRRSHRNFAANKTRTVAWMVSHCSTFSLRENYVNELKKYIDVDVYGKCGNLSCARNATHWLSEPHCYDQLEMQYKFYLSFENSLCTDYVTEKFFEILAHDLVPVVYGAADYSAIAPRHSFINALDFTPKQLADYLRQLDANDTLYNEFFWWKGHYQVESGVEQMARNGFCDLCKKLHEDRRVQIIPEMQSKWSPDAQCVNLSAMANSSFFSIVQKNLFGRQREI